MQTDTTKPASFITNLPNEVLSTILSFLPYKNFCDMLALRAVSRQFYRAVYETDFWYHDDLRFSTSDLSIPEHNRATMERWDYERVLADERLVKVLGHRRKSGWTFYGIQEFLVVIERIPEFYQNTRRIFLYSIDHGLGIVIDKLSSCQFITELFICFSYETINLDSIANSCPFLENLRISSLDKYRGTLWHNKNLKRLSIHFSDSGSTPMLTSALIPVDSARTLKSLSLIDCLTIASDFHQNPLDGFHNLRYLKLSPLLYDTEDFCDLLIDADVTLANLEVDI